MANQSIWVLTDRLEEGLAKEVMIAPASRSFPVTTFKAMIVPGETGDYIILKERGSTTNILDTAYTPEGASKALYKYAIEEMPENKFLYYRDGQENKKQVTHEKFRDKLKIKLN